MTGDAVSAPLDVDAPEWIWLCRCDDPHCEGSWAAHYPSGLVHSVEYVRADQLDASETEVRRLRCALEEISRDPLEHCQHAVENMRALALAALAPTPGAGGARG